ncbi:MAG: apolipoprotein N-acyltransferase [Candidatus Aquicultorales bacterium]
MADRTAEFSLDRKGILTIATHWKRPALATAAGLLMALAFPNSSIWLFSFAALPLLLSAVKGVTPRWAFGLGWLSGFVFYLFLAYWLSVFGVTVAIMLSAFMGLFTGLFALGAVRLMGQEALWVRLLGIPALWVALEYAHSTGTYSFPWGILGESIKQPALMQAASVVGGFGLSFLVVLVSLLLYEVLTGDLRKRKICLVASVGILGAWLAFGFFSLSREIPAPSLSLAIVQGNVEQSVKLDPDAADQSKELYSRLTVEAAKRRPDVIVWPETAVPNELLYDPAYVKEVTVAAQKAGSLLIAGAFDRDSDKVYNSAILLGAGEPKTYNKMQLVPWGEFTPLRSISSRVNSLAGLGVDQTPGTKLTPISIRGRKIAALICFESAYSRQAAAMARSGARLGLVITNNGWFGRTSAAEQHFQLARFRAIENGMYVAQAANTGISGVIDPRGKVLARTGLEKRVILDGRVGFADGTTAYCRVADILPFVYVLLSIGCVFGKRNGINGSTPTR